MSSPRQVFIRWGEGCNANKEARDFAGWVEALRNPTEMGINVGVRFAHPNLRDAFPADSAALTPLVLILTGIKCGSQPCFMVPVLCQLGIAG